MGTQGDTPANTLAHRTVSHVASGLCIVRCGVRRHFHESYCDATSRTRCFHERGPLAECVCVVFAWACIVWDVSLIVKRVYVSMPL